MAESSPSHVTPSDKLLERALRHAVQVVYKTGNLEDLTVKRMRKAAEEELDLHLDFFKEPVWKDRSRAIIENEVEILENALPNSSQPESAKPTPVKPTKKSNLPDRSDKKKPSSPSDPKPAKRRKVSEKQEPEDAVGEDEGLAEPEDRPAKANGKPRSRTKTSESLLSDVPDVGEDNLKPDAEATPLGQGSESDLSDVIDDGPKPKGRKRRPGPGEATSKAPKKKKAAQKPQDADPDAEEIKRLQGWLIKCGIRKMWYKELAPYDTPKAKIRHLKEMLAEAGMTGRYSQEKATEIKEARELKADLEAVQDGAKLWGKGESEEEEQEEGQSRPKRRLARGLQSLDFLNDDDGEETD